MEQQKKQPQTWTTINWHDAGAVRRLLDRGADPNAVQQHSSLTPLHRAVQSDAPGEVVRLLLEAGADPAREHYLRGTPLEAAAHVDAVGAARALLEAGSRDQEALRMAARYGSNGVLRLLLDYGADVNHRYGDMQMTALHINLDSRHVNVETIRILLERGADIEAVDKNRRTPLHIAARRQDTNILQELLSRGADTRARDVSGETALHIAVGHNLYENILLLLKRGDDPNARGSNGKTALHEAAENNTTVNAIDLLFSYGADPYLRDSYRSTAFSAARGNSDFQRALLDHGYIPLPEEIDEEHLSPEIRALAQARMQEIEQAEQRFRLIEKRGVKQQKNAQKKQQKNAQKKQQSKKVESARRASRFAGTMPHQLFLQLVHYGVPSLFRDQEQKNRFDEWCRRRNRRAEQADLLRRTRWLEQMRYQQKRSARKR